MSSTIHSPPSTSTDVVLCPHPLNHVNHNHTESTKSLKRTRDETNDSSIIIDTPTKRSRKKRSTTDIDQSLGLVIYLSQNFHDFIFFLQSAFIR